MKLIVQPYHEKLGNLLEADLASGKFASLTFFVAYAKTSGVDALYDPLLAFKAAGGSVHATIGIDQKNTSYEALRAVLGLAEDLYVFHNKSLSSTFHPKVFILAGEEYGKIYIGSNNLTSGGLYTNYEVASCEDFDLTVPASAETFANMYRTLGGFRQEGVCCKRATEELIQELYDDHMICTEKEISIVSKKRNGTRSGYSEHPLFGTEMITGKTRKHNFTHLAPTIQVRQEYQETDDGLVESKVEDITSGEETGPARSFYKRLSKNDVDLKSSPGQIIIPIAYKSFFEPLSEPQITKVGAMQSERYFNIKYENNGEIVENARVIFYVPAPHAPRKNSEVRFALRNRDIFGEFEQNDVLVFSQAPRSRQGQYLYTVKRVPHGNPEVNAYPERFAWIE